MKVWIVSQDVKINDVQRRLFLECFDGSTTHETLIDSVCMTHSRMEMPALVSQEADRLQWSNGIKAILTEAIKGVSHL